MPRKKRTTTKRTHRVYDKEFRQEAVQMLLDGHFARPGHHDGCVERDNGERSQLAYMIYLNVGGLRNVRPPLLENWCALPSMA